MPADFVWRDAGREVVFGTGLVGRARAVLDERGIESFRLLSTERAIAAAPELADAAEVVHFVPAGGVPKAAAALMDATAAANLVAFGGGRVIDAAKAIAAVSGAAVTAVPTTLSGAEMTGIHRLPEGAEDNVSGLVRPQLVIADPEPMTGLEEGGLRASAMNALAHGADSLYTKYANPVSRMTALDGAARIARALDESRESRDRAGLALGSILCGYAIDSGMFALHHVTCQNLVRICGSPHAETNAAILPRAMATMAPRAPEQVGELALAIGCELDGIEDRILALGGEPSGLGAVGADASKLDQAIAAILSRTELGFAPDPPAGDELRQMIERAW